MKVEQITPYGTHEGKTEQVREMFDSIAPAYDLMNAAMTLGMDRGWRRKAVSLLGPASRYGRVLDIATGTADIAIKLAQTHATPRVVGIDLSEGMLEVGRRKVSEARLPQGCSIELQQGDSLALPFENESFDGAICAYGVRNFSDIARGLGEMARVLRPGGALVILELSTPRSPLVKPFYNLYTRGFIPLLGRLVSKDPRAYSYLPESIAAVPQGAEMTSLMEQAGFSRATAISLFLGVCTIYHALK